MMIDEATYLGSGISEHPDEREFSLLNAMEKPVHNCFHRSL